MDMKEDFLQWFTIFLINKLLVVEKREVALNKLVADKLHKPIIRNFKNVKFTDLL